MESRKRPLVDAEDSVVTKKRVLSNLNGSPHVNGMAEDDEAEIFREKLETYRKEAIFRRMQHYSRENERSQARIKILEDRKSTCEAGLAAISACWSQLVETIKLFVKTDEIPEGSLRAREIFNLTTRIEEDSFPELTSALNETVNATQALVTKFVQLSDDNKSRVVATESFEECQEAQNECVLLRSEVKFLQTKLQESQALAEEYHTRLVAAEGRFDRSQSSIVREVESKSTDGIVEGREEKEEVLRKPSSPAASSVTATPVITNGGFHDVSDELQALNAQIKARDEQILELEREAAVFKDEKIMLQIDTRVSPKDQLDQHPYCKFMLEHIASQDMSLKDQADEIKRLSDEIESLLSQSRDRQSIYNKTATAFEQTISELNSKLIEKRDENARLRVARNQLEAENKERRALEGMRHSSVQELKTLTESNSERILALQSELKRCKAKLAVKAGAEELLDFFLADNHDESMYFESVKQEKVRLANRVTSLEQALAGIDSEHPDVANHLRAEVDALERLSIANKTLEQHRRIFGGASDIPPDATKFAQELRCKDVELQRLQLHSRELEESQSSIYTELDQLATQWEALDKQVKSKVFNLQSLEERLQKSLIDKAKAETKFFEAVKMQQALEAERRAIQRNLELENKVKESEMQLAQKLQQANISLEVQNSALRKGTSSIAQKLKDCEKETGELRAEFELERRRFKEYTIYIRERELYLSKTKNDLRTKEDDINRMQRELEKQIEKARREVEIQKLHSKPNVVESELENLRSLLQCTTCRGPPRSIIITKCMHTFCKSCIDTRLATRQRKCPACNVQFGASDVHTFFLQ